MKEMLEMVTSNPKLADYKRRRKLSNDDLFNDYLNDMTLRQLSDVYISDTKDLLFKFKAYLNNKKPTAELGKAFLAQYRNRKESTRDRYYTLVNEFLKYCGCPIELKRKHHKNVPPYYTDTQILKLIEAAKDKKSHKKLAERDVLLIEVMARTGMRRAETANLKVKDINFDTARIQIVMGKGGKTRTVPLFKVTAKRLKTYCEHKKDSDNVFGLTPESISNKIKRLAEKADVDLHAHSLRHYFGTHLYESGVDIRVLSISDMGHFLNRTLWSRQRDEVAP